MRGRAREQMLALADELGLPAGVCNVEAGSTRGEILRYARERNIDLIVLGSRERHGLSLLLHRGEGSLLQAAPCDVLAVRMR
jgi:universal stress protein A